MATTKHTVIEIWDRPLRLFHWALAGTLAGLFASAWLGGAWLNAHKHLGAIVLALITFRIAWGFLGTTHSRFASFWPTRASIQHCFTSGWTGIGHSPLGALSVFAMLGAILMQAGSGLFTEDDIGGFRGPLHALIDAERAPWLSAFHAQNTWLLLALITLHVTAITYYAGIKRMNIIRPMLTGNIEITGQAQGPGVHAGKKPRVTAAFAMGAAVFFAVEYETWSDWLLPAATYPTGAPTW